MMTGMVPAESEPPKDEPLKEKDPAATVVPVDRQRMDFGLKYISPCLK